MKSVRMFTPSTDTRRRYWPSLNRPGATMSSPSSSSVGNM